MASAIAANTPHCSALRKSSAGTGGNGLGVCDLRCASGVAIFQIEDVAAALVQVVWEILESRWILMPVACLHPLSRFARSAQQLPVPLVHESQFSISPALVET